MNSIGVNNLKKIELNGYIIDQLIETTEVTAGDLIIFTEDVYTDNFFNAKIIGRRTIIARALKQSYGNSYITYSLEVLDCVGFKANEVKEKKYIRKRESHILGKYKVYRKLWNNEINRCYLLDSLREFKHELELQENIS